jgi:hypothetical protein
LCFHGFSPKYFPLYVELYLKKKFFAKEGIDEQQEYAYIKLFEPSYHGSTDRAGAKLSYTLSDGKIGFAV